MSEPKKKTPARRRARKTSRPEHPLQIRHQSGQVGWDRARVIEILTERLTRDPLLTLAGVMEDDWVDPETGTPWPMPSRQIIHTWMVKHPAECQTLFAVRKLQTLALMDEAQRQMMDDSQDFLRDEATGKLVANSPRMQRLGMLQREAQWRAARLLRQEGFGDKTEVEHSGEIKDPSGIAQVAALALQAALDGKQLDHDTTAALRQLANQATTVDENGNPVDGGEA